MVKPKALDKNIIAKNQNISIDIMNTYNDFITSLNKIRSTRNPIGYLKFGKINDKSISDFCANSDTTPSLKESYISAFYRYIGFPIFNSSKEFFNPGFDRDANGNKEVLQTKLDIINKLSEEEEKSFNKRDNNFKERAQIFELGSALLKTTYCSALGNFPIIFRDIGDISDPFSGYTLAYSSANREDIISDYTFNAVKNNVITKEEVTNNFNKKIVSPDHIIKPFAVDPRIEYTVSEAKRKIAVPFVTDFYRVVDSTEQKIQVPFLENVILDRFSKTRKVEIKNKSEYVKNLLDKIKADSNYKDKKTTEFDSNLDKMEYFDLYRFNYYIDVIYFLMKSLYFNVKTVNEITDKICWTPFPKSSGILDGVSLLSISNSPVNLYKQIETDWNILSRNKDVVEIEKMVQELKSWYNKSENLDNSTSDRLAYEANGNLIKINEEMSTLNKKRESIGKIANQSLQEIDAITGETLCLGLFDINAIYAAFYIMNKKHLINMLDDRAFNRLYSYKDLRSPEVEDRKSGNKIDIYEVMREFESKLSQVYNIANSFYLSFFSTKNS